MAKQFPLDKTICLDILGRPVKRGDFVIYPYGEEFHLGVAKKPNKTNHIEGVTVTKVVGAYGYDNRTLPGSRLFLIGKEEGVTMLTKAKLENFKSVRPAGIQLLGQIEKQRKRVEET